MSRHLSPPALDLRGLLTIDVAAELRKLCQAQLEGPWQLPAELVRRASRAGASTVEVAFGRHRVTVTDDGPGLDPALLHWTAVLADPRQHNDERHRALTALERAGELALLALVGLDRLRELRIDTAHGSQHHRLLLRAGRAPLLSYGAGPAPPGTRVAVRAAGLPRRRAADWLRDVARFAPLRVVVDGAPVVDGFAGSLIQAPLDPPLRGRVALVPDADTAHAYLLAHGLVTGHLTIPDAPAFEAALEVATPGGDLAPARLREAAAAYVPGLIDQAALLIVRAAWRPPWPERQRAHLAGLALKATRRSLRSEEIERAPLWRMVGASGPALASLGDLRALAGAGGSGSGTLMALSPDQDPDRFAVGDGPVLVADEAERSLLAELLGIRFRIPSRRQSSHSLGATVRGLLHDLQHALADGLDLIRHPLRPPALADKALTREEQALLFALRAELQAQPGTAAGAGSHLPVGQAILCAGAGPVRRTRDRPATLILPRSNPLVRACVRAFGIDRDLLKLIHLALVAGAAGRRIRS
jgi:hypothetical protein